MQIKKITLEQVLAARDARAEEQRKLLERFSLPLVCFTMNIAGPVKTSALIKRAFIEGCKQIEKSLKYAGLQVKYQKTLECAAGSTAFFVVQAQAEELKKLCVKIENDHPLGRLFDIDVLTDRGKIERCELGEAPRKCLICDKQAQICGSRRAHSARELQAKTVEIIEAFFAKYDRVKIARNATKALLAELEVTPKPGLVDLENNGSHTDMNPEVFRKSAAALEPYWLE